MYKVFPRSKIYDDVIYLSMVYTDTLDNNEIKRWLLCLDADGNERFYIKSLGAIVHSRQLYFRKR
ncbi:MAG: hypothetical protein IPN46_04320 [Saprospiraceae bacterium]|nr:hypothetical protein [Saprospiraceae bacterium]